MKFISLFGYEKYKDDEDIETGYDGDYNTRDMSFYELVYVMSYMTILIGAFGLIYLCFIELD